MPTGPPATLTATEVPRVPTPAPTVAPPKPTPTPTRPAPTPPPALPPPLVPSPTPPPPELGTLEVRVTDQPARNIEAIVVTSSMTEINRQESETAATGWVTVLDEEVSFDLLEVAGIEKSLRSVELEPGRYGQIRMHVKSVVVTIDGEETEASVPSDIIRVVQSMTVVAGETTIATFDFNAQKSVVVTGADRVIFKPVIKVLVRKGTATFRPEPTETPEPTPSPTVVPTATPVPTPTATPEPTATFTPSPSPTPSEDPLGDVFFLEILSPQPEPGDELAFVSERTVEIVGRTRVDAPVSIDDTFLEVDEEGVFRLNVEVGEGFTVVEVVASVTGQEESIVLTLAFEEPP